MHERTEANQVNGLDDKPAPLPFLLAQRVLDNFVESLTPPMIGALLSPRPVAAARRASRCSSRCSPVIVAHSHQA